MLLFATQSTASGALVQLRGAEWRRLLEELGPDLGRRPLLERLRGQLPDPIPTSAVLRARVTADELAALEALAARLGD